MMPKPIYLFVDNSNLWIEGKKVSGRQQNPPVPSNYRYRIEYGKLLSHVIDGRQIGDVPRLYGSEPPPNDSVWKIIRSKGFDVNVFKRNIFNKEKGVDMKMGMDITRLILGVKPAGIIALVAGDADFLPVVEEARSAGWEIEVWYWANAAQLLQRNATRFIDLSPSLDAVGFEER
jgi:uncharacterized LabA/DUF88 family protein